MTEPRLTRALAALRDGFDQLSPGRDRASDGWIGDTRHQQYKSGHNPDDTAGSLAEYTDADSTPEVRAVDVDADLNHPTVTMSAAIARILATPADRARLRYVIWQRRIASASSGWAWRAYDGDSPHTEHAHFSGNPDHDDDGRPWSVATMGDDDMPTATEIASAVWNHQGDDPVDRSTHRMRDYLRFAEYNMRQQIAPALSKLDALAAVLAGHANGDWLRERFAEIDQRFAEQRAAIGEVPDAVVGELGGLDVGDLVDALDAAGVDLDALAVAAMERAARTDTAGGEQPAGEPVPA